MFVPGQPGKLELLVVVTAIGAQPVVALALKLACTAGTTQIVLIMVSGSQALLNATNPIE
jgi:N-acetylmuramic acid 6-phosphate (MurNAc-6-P) etherase